LQFFFVFELALEQIDDLFLFFLCNKKWQ
jgi:hypothetical protein